MRPQQIKDNQANIVLLFATRAKQTVENYTGVKFTIMRSDLRAALLQEDSAKRGNSKNSLDWDRLSSVWTEEEGTHFVQLWAKFGEDAVFCGPSVYTRVPARYYPSVTVNGIIAPSVMRVGCTTFVGSYARAFYKWAALGKPTKKGVKRGKK